MQYAVEINSSKSILKMKKILIAILIFFPLILLGQNDFDTRYFTINAKSLPELPQITSSSFTLYKAPVLSQKLPSFKMTKENFWQPVDMAEAISDSRKFVNSAVNINPINAKEYGLTGYGSYPADKNSAPVNIVYKESRGLDLLDPCPPFGICARCAPYRVGRGY